MAVMVQCTICGKTRGGSNGANWCHPCMSAVREIASGAVAGYMAYSSPNGTYITKDTARTDAVDLAIGVVKEMNRRCYGTDDDASM